MLHSAGNYETFWNVFARHYAQFCKIAACAGKKWAKLNLLWLFSSLHNQIKLDLSLDCSRLVIKTIKEDSAKCLAKERKIFY